MASALKSMEILDEHKGTGMLNRYLVQVRPGRQLMRLTQYDDFDIGNYDDDDFEYVGGEWSTMIDLPLPYVIYNIAIPKRGGGGATSLNIMGAKEALKGKDKEEIYHLPLPNTYGVWNDIGHCGWDSHVNPDQPIEHQVAQVILDCWASGWRYVLIPTGGKYGDPDGEFRRASFKHLGMPRDVLNHAYYTGRIYEVYKTWETLTVEQALEFPWWPKPIGTLGGFRSSSHWVTGY